jgi:hypothetical protein
MAHISPVAALAALAAVQIAGLCCALAARVAARTRFEPACHGLFYASLVLVGLAAIAAFSRGMGSGLVCGTTLAVMTVTAIVDFGPARHVGQTAARQAQSP